MKLIDILKSASGNIWQSKLRTFLTIIAIFIGAFTLTLTTAIGAGISQYIDGQVNSIGAKNVLIITPQSPSALGSDPSQPQKYNPDQARVTGQFSAPALTDSDLVTIRQQVGITDASPRLFVSPTYIEGENGEKFGFSLREYIEGTNVAMNSGVMVDNAVPANQLSLPYNFILALGYNNYQDAIGKNVVIGITDANGTLTKVLATITGVPQKSLIDAAGGSVNSTLFNALYQAQSVGVSSRTLNKYTAATAHFDNSYTASQISDLENRLKDKGYAAQTFGDTIATVNKIISSIIIVFDIFAIIALLAASFGVINTLLMSVQERTKEIGLMKAMGMRRSRIFLLFSSEAILLGFWGSFLGVAVAFVLGQIANQVATNTFLKDFEGLHLLAFPPLNLLFIMLGIMAVAFLAGTLPARRAAGLNPIDALRYE